MVEVSRREKQAGVVPDPDVDTYMKVPLLSVFFFPLFLVLPICFMSVCPAFIMLPHGKLPPASLDRLLFVMQEHGMLLRCFFLRSVVIFRKLESLIFCKNKIYFWLNF